MAVYNNLSQKSPIDTVEFTPVPEGNTSFFRLREGADADAVKQSLMKDLGQQIEATTQLDKQTILVTRGDKGQDELLAGLKEQGYDLAAVPPPEKHIDMWKARGALSMIGHPMQLVSGSLTRGFDVATIGFAVSNLLANLTNVFFGAEKKTDPHHLRFIKTEVNKLLTPYVPGGQQLPDPDDQRAPLRQDPGQPPTIGQRFHGFMKRHSVMFGEIGLRYVGGISLVLPFLKDAQINGDDVKINGMRAEINEDGKVVIGGKPIATKSNPAGGTDLEYDIKTLEINGKNIPLDSKVFGADGRQLLGKSIGPDGKEMLSPTRGKQLGIEEANDVVKLQLDGKAVKVGSHWRTAFKELFTGKPAEALHRVKNVDKFTLYAGSFWLAGKTIAFASKVPDPYDPDKPDPNSTHGVLDKIREKYLFKISTATEAMGATTLAYDRFFRRKITIPEGWKFIPEKVPSWPIIPKKIPGWSKEREIQVDGKSVKVALPENIPVWKSMPPVEIDGKAVKLEMPFLERLGRAVTGKNLPGMELRGMQLRGLTKAGERVKVPDFIGGVGSLLFALAFVMRFNAPFGVREVNMDEVDAHVADSLAKIPPAKLPQAVAESAAFLTEHFKDKKLNYGEVYNKLVSDLYDDHNIALPGADGGTGIASAGPQAPTPVQEEQKKIFAKPELKKANVAAMARSKHFRDRINPVMESEALGP